MRAGRDPQVEELIQDLEAFLAGRYLDHLTTHALAVPTWAWLNKAAHGTEQELRHWYAVKLVLHPASAWEAAAHYMVAEVLDALDAGWSLDELQREVLVPFESVVASDPDRAWTPGGLAQDVVKSMDAYIDEYGEYPEGGPDA